MPMTVSIKQEDSLCLCLRLRLGSKLDTVVMIWRADDDQANVVHDIVKNEMKYGDAAELRPQSGTSRHSGMSGCIFLAYGEDGMDRLDAMIVDNLAAELPCETERSRLTQCCPAAVLPANENERKEAPQTDLQ